MVVKIPNPFVEAQKALSFCFDGEHFGQKNAFAQDSPEIENGRTSLDFKPNILWEGCLVQYINRNESFGQVS